MQHHRRQQQYTLHQQQSDGLGATSSSSSNRNSNSNSSGIPSDILFQLFSQVRLPFLQYDELQEVIRDALVPSSLLFEALMARIAFSEGMPLPTLNHHQLTHNSLSSTNNVNNNNNPTTTTTIETRLQKRQLAGLRIFEYSGNHQQQQLDFEDKGGVCYYIGTKGGIAKWRNPCLVENGITVTASSIEKGDPVNIVGRGGKPLECWTMDVPSSWMCVDLGAYRSLVLTNISLRHGGNSKQDCLRNWVLQSSNDLQNWTVLSRHRDDKTIDSPFACHTWSISSCTKPYRYFRVLQTGRNSSFHNFLSLSQIELYGELYEQPVQLLTPPFSSTTPSSPSQPLLQSPTPLSSPSPLPLVTSSLSPSAPQSTLTTSTGIGSN